MFRKPKNKGAIRSRKTSSWDEKDDEDMKKIETPDDEEVMVMEPKIVKEEPKSTGTSSKFSFDMDEGADAAFEVKKNKKTVEELKRMQKLELEAEKLEAERKKMEESRKRDLEEVVKKEKKAKEKNTRNERQKYLDKYRDASAKHVGGYDEDLDIDESAIDMDSTDSSTKFASSLAGIPDSRAVYEAKKRRERMRKEGNDGYIPLDDDQKIRPKGVRNRLIREDENDESDEEQEGNFYSAKDLFKSEEQRRREEQNEFLNRENDDDDVENMNNDYKMEEWERQQIRKAVSGRAIGRLAEEKRHASQMFGGKQQEVDESVDMDIDMDVELDKPSFTGPANTGGEIKIEDILAKLKLRITEREEALNFRRSEANKMKEHLDENRNMMEKIEMELPSMSQKFTMYQEMRVYSRSLLECLNEKVPEINEIGDKKRQCAKSRALRLKKRRRQDVSDQYAECSAAASGKGAASVKVGDAATRAADREGRRRRRRREREERMVLEHEDGMSTDEEEATSRTAADKEIWDETEAAGSVVFADALDEYANMRKVLDRMADWLAVDTQSFQDAYVHLCIPKLCSPFIRLQLIMADLLQKDVDMSSMQWFNDSMSVTADGIDNEHEIIVGLVPAMVDKVVIPFLIDMVKDVWDPLSLSQTKRLAEFCRLFEIMAALDEKSKSYVSFLEAIRGKIMEVIEEDLFIPMFAPAALEKLETGCRAFQDRQFWTGLKLVRGINALKGLISVAARFEFVVEKIVNGSLVVAIRAGLKNEASAERKVRALLKELDDDLLRMGGMSTLKQLSSALSMVRDAQVNSGREYAKDLSLFIQKLER